MYEGFDYQGNMKLRIVAADDDPECLREILSLLKADFDVVATAADGKSALDTIRGCRPDIAVLDLTMPGLNGIEIVRELKIDGSGPAVLICSVETDPDIVDTAREAGASGYVFKGCILDDLTDAIELIAEGQSFWPSLE